MTVQIAPINAKVVRIIATQVVNDNTIDIVFCIKGLSTEIRSVEVSKNDFETLNLGEVQEFWCDYTCKSSYQFVPYEFDELSSEQLCHLVNYNLDKSEKMSYSTFEDCATRNEYEAYLEVCGLKYKTYATQIPYDLPLPSMKYYSQKMVFRSQSMLYVEARTKHEARLLFQDFVGAYEIQNVVYAHWSASN